MKDNENSEECSSDEFIVYINKKWQGEEERDKNENKDTNELKEKK